MRHVREVAQLTIKSETNASTGPCTLIFSRAFLIDAYKGGPEGTNMSSVCNGTSCVKPTENVGPLFLDTPQTSRYIHSMSYALSVLNQAESDDTTSVSSKDESHDVSLVPLVKYSSKATLGDTASKHIVISDKPNFVLEDDVDELLREMQAYGYPTSFGSYMSYTRGSKSTSITSATDDENRFGTLDKLVLLSTAHRSISTDCIIRKRSSSLPDISILPSIRLKEVIGEGVADAFRSASSLYSPSGSLHTLCRVIGLKYSAANSARQPRHPCHCLRLPERWMNAKPWNIDKACNLILSRNYKQLIHRPVLQPSSPDNDTVTMETLKDCETELNCTDVQKYWSQRYRLFSRFDQGIQIDTVGLFSATPEVIAFHQAKRFKAKFADTDLPVLDMFAGTGSNAIQLALLGFKVVAVELSAIRVAMAVNNAKVYQVSERVTFVTDDVITWAHAQLNSHTGGGAKFAAAFLSPPWGGPQYQSKDVYSVHSIELDTAAASSVSKPSNIETVISLASKMTAGNLAIFLPRNTNIAEIPALASIAEQAKGFCYPHRDGCTVEVETSLINRKIKAITLYCGQLVAFPAFSADDSVNTHPEFYHV